MTNSAGIPSPMAEERAAPRSGSSLTGSYLEREEERRWRTAKAEFSRFRDRTIDSRFSRGTANFEKKKIAASLKIFYKTMRIRLAMEITLEINF